MLRVLYFAIVSIFIYLTLDLSAFATMLFYKTGATPNSANMHTIIYTDKVGSVPVIGGSIEINGQSITVYGRPDEVNERNVLLSGQLIKTRLYSDKAGAHLRGIAYFSDGKLLQGRLRAQQNEIVFIEDGFVSGKIDSFTPTIVLINDHGSPRSVQLSTVLAIRSPRVYNLQIDLASVPENNPSVSANTTESKNSERQYNITSCILKETIPPQMISSQSIAPKSSDDDDFNDLDPDDDILLDPSLSKSLIHKLGQ